MIQQSTQQTTLKLVVIDQSVSVLITTLYNLVHILPIYHRRTLTYLNQFVLYNKANN